MIKESARCEHGEHWLLCQYCGERNRDEVGECFGKNGAQALADMRTLFDWTKLDEGHNAVIEHVNGRHYITLWPEGEVCTGDDGSGGKGALAKAAEWLCENVPSLSEGHK